MWVDNVISHKEKYSLRGNDLMNIIKTKLVVYHDLANVNRLEQLFDAENRFILLMESKRNSGHYVSILYDADRNILEFFDSYGHTHNDLIQDLHYYVEARNGKYFLMNLFEKFQRQTGCRILYNRTPFQQLDGDINTCGRWAYLRAKYHYLTQEDFNRGIVYYCRKHKLEYDAFVTLCTMLVH